MEYKEKRLEEIGKKYFRNEPEQAWERSFAVTDEICEEVYQEKGACYSSDCLEALKKTYLGKIVTDEKDLLTIWYCGSQRHHAKLENIRKKEKERQGYTKISEISLKAGDKIEYIRDSESILGRDSTTHKGRIKDWGEQGLVIMPPRARTKGYQINRVDVQDWYVKVIK